MSWYRLLINMPKKKSKKTAWNDVNTSIKEYDRSQLVDLVRDLYQLSDTNKNFLHSRYSIGNDPLQPYKKIIENTLYPDVLDNYSDIDFDRAENAIYEYSKAVGNPEGIADLMISFVECGNKFTLDFGDIYEEYYDALVDMYDKAIMKVLEIPVKKQVPYQKRLKEIMESSNGIGWGYHDGLCDCYYEAFQKE